MAPLGQVAVEDYPLMGLAQEEVEAIQSTLSLWEVDQEEAGLEEAADLAGVPVQVPEGSSKLMKDISLKWHALARTEKYIYCLDSI